MYAPCRVVSGLCRAGYKSPSQADPGFLCGKMGGVIFTASLGPKNNVLGRQYSFALTVSEPCLVVLPVVP